MPVYSKLPKGFFITLSDTPHSDAEKKHYFCGENNISGAICPNCNKALLILLTVDLTDERLSLSNRFFNKLPLLFCWTCDLARYDFYYKIENEREINILYYKKGNVYDDFPYSNYPNYFPQKYARLEKISKYYQDVISKLNKDLIKYSEVLRIDSKLTSPQHQIGGEPYLLQGEIDDLACPTCNQQMPFLAAICDDNGDQRGFVGNDYVQIIYYYCEKCNVIGAMQESD